MEKELINSLENGDIDSIKEKLADYEKMNGPKETQTLINDIYKNVNKTGKGFLDDVVKGLDEYKSYDEYMKDYDQIDEISALFSENGSAAYYSLFEDSMDSISKEDRQEAIDRIYENLPDSKDKKAFSKAVDRYSSEKGDRLSTVNVKEADEIADKLYSCFDGTAKGIGKFKFALLETEKVTRPEEFQKAIDILDRKLNSQQVKALDAAVKAHNANSRDGVLYETRRLQLSKEDKEQSWENKQKYHMSPSDKAKSFTSRLKTLYKERVRPEDKYDNGFINAALRTLTNIQNFITEVADYIKENLDKACNCHQDENEEKETPVDSKESSKEGSKEGKPEVTKTESPFYDIMKNAYAEKGRTIVSLIESDLIDRESAENLFAMDIAYIKSMPEHQTELFQEYTKGLQDVLSQDVSVETRNAVFQMMKDYDDGKFDEKIAQNIKEGFDWNDIKPDWNKTQEQKTKIEVPEIESKTESKTKTSKTVEDKVKADIIIKASEIGAEVANAGHKTKDDLDKDLNLKMEELRLEHPEFNSKDALYYKKIAISSLMTHDLHPEGLFSKVTPEQRMKVLVNAAVAVDKAYHNDFSKNAPLTDLSRGIGKEISVMKNQADRQDFVADIADKLEYPKQQLFFGMKVNEYSLRPEARTQVGSEEKAQKLVQELAEKYKLGAKYTRNDFSVLANKMPECLGGPQFVFDELKEALKDDTRGMSKMLEDAGHFDKVSQRCGLEGIQMASVREDFDR